VGGGAGEGGVSWFDGWLWNVSLMSRLCCSIAPWHSKRSAFCLERPSAQQVSHTWLSSLVEKMLIKAGSNSATSWSARDRSAATSSAEANPGTATKPVARGCWVGRRAACCCVSCCCVSCCCVSCCCVSCCCVSCCCVSAIPRDFGNRATHSNAVTHHRARTSLLAAA